MVYHSIDGLGGGEGFEEGFEEEQEEGEVNESYNNMDDSIMNFTHRYS